MSRLGATEETAVACCALVMSILDECSVLAAPAGAGKLEQGSRRICRSDEETRLRSDLSSLLRLSAGARVGIPRASAIRMGLPVAEGNGLPTHDPSQFETGLRRTATSTYESGRCRRSFEIRIIAYTLKSNC